MTGQSTESFEAGPLTRSVVTGTKEGEGDGMKMKTILETYNLIHVPISYTRKLRLKIKNLPKITLFSKQVYRMVGNWTVFRPECYGIVVLTLFALSLSLKACPIRRPCLGRL